MPMQGQLKPQNILRMVKLAHTLIWVFLTWCVLTIPYYGYRGRFLISVLLFGIVILETIVLALNRMRCPLTDIAARYTSERRENFDIYLPLWLARYNQLIFGGLFMAGSLYTLYRWWSGHGSV